MALVPDACALDGVNDASVYTLASVLALAQVCLGSYSGAAWSLRLHWMVGASHTRTNACIQTSECELTPLLEAWMLSLALNERLLGV